MKAEQIIDGDERRKSERISAAFLWKCVQMSHCMPGHGIIHRNSHGKSANGIFAVWHVYQQWIAWHLLRFFIIYSYCCFLCINRTRKKSFFPCLSFSRNRKLEKWMNEWADRWIEHRKLCKNETDENDLNLKLSKMRVNGQKINFVSRFDSLASFPLSFSPTLPLFRRVNNEPTTQRTKEEIEME